MKTPSCLLVFLIGLGAAVRPVFGGEPAAATPSPAINVPTAAEKAEGWQQLFDGTSFAGWRGYRLPGPPPAGSEIRDGLLGTVANVRGVELITEKQFTDFELSWEWRIVVRGTRVEHWLNGRNVLTYETSSPEVKAGVAASKFRNEPGIGDKATGHLMLTYHSDACWYGTSRSGS